MLLEIYPFLLWTHVVAVIVWGGAMLVDFGGWTKRISLSLALVAGVLLFAAKPEYSNHPAFWIKMGLLALLGGNEFLLRPGGKVRFAGALSLLLMSGAILAARGPATVKDIMRSMVDPSADFLFQSVQIVSNEDGIREVAPQTAEEWQDVRARVQVLLDAPAMLSAPGRRAARPRDRAQSPEVENEPSEVQLLLDRDHPDFVRRADALRDAATMALRAADAKDKDALMTALVGIDRACESCHIHYWYPKDARAREAARESGILE